MAAIRRATSADDKIVRFHIGKANMEPITVANFRTYIHPLMGATWVGLACIMIQFMNWWPNPEVNGKWSYLQPLPAFGAMVVPLLLLADWLNRPYFEESTQKVLRAPDLRDFAAHYTKSSSSGLWILENDGQFIGLIGLDATPPSTSTSPTASAKRSHIHSVTAERAEIRHFFVDGPYRLAGAQDDLLKHALQQAFQRTGLKSVEAEASPLQQYIKTSLLKAGFASESTKEKVGTLGWKIETMVLDRETWEKKQD